MQATKAGEPLFKDLSSLAEACKLMGATLVKGKEYHWFGRHVGDYPMPPGMKAEELGKNAEYVIKLSEDKKKEIGSPNPYDIGIVPDPNNPGCFVPIYDFWGGGYGVDKVFGSPIQDKERGLVILPKLQQTYHMMCDAAAAKAVGDSVEFLTAEQAHKKYPQLFTEPITDKSTWVSIVNTQNRVGVR